MKTIKTGISSKLVALLAGAALFGLVSQSALAVCTVGVNCTAANTSIGNIATVQYTVGGVPQLSIDSKVAGNSTPNTVTGIPGVGQSNGVATSFVVDLKVDLTVTGGVIHNVTPGQAAATPASLTGAYTQFNVTNLSNTDLDFILTAADAAAATASAVAPIVASDAFDSTGLTIYRAAAGGASVALSATAVAATTVTIPAATTWTVYVASDIPVVATNNQMSLISLQAQAAWGAALPVGWTFTTAQTVNTAVVFTPLATVDNPANVDVVFADTTGVLGTDIARDGIHSGYEAYKIASAVLTVSKTATLLCDPFNGNANPKNIPGSITRWTITVSNAGPGAATLTSISDTLAASLTHDANLVTGLTAAACVSAAPGVPESGAGNGFKVVPNAPRELGGSASAPGQDAVSFFTTTATADGLDIAGQAITATFATILPVDGVHGSAAGELLSGDSVTITFNTTVQ